MDSITEIKLILNIMNLLEIQIPNHPIEYLQGFDRFIQVKKISLNLELPRTYVSCSQVLKDADGNIIASNLPVIDLAVLENDVYPIRDENFEVVSFPKLDGDDNPVLDEDGEPITEVRYENAHDVIVRVFKNDDGGFQKLLEYQILGALQNPSFIDELNKL